MAAYPTGVENHGGKLRIWFMYKGARVRESIGCPDTVKNRKMAGDLRTSVCFDIKTGNFSYADRFPNSANLTRFGEKKKDITILELSNKWMALKGMEIAESSKERYQSKLTNTICHLGENRMVSSITQEDLLGLRMELLTGPQSRGKGQKTIRIGRSAVTVNDYFTCISAMLTFAFSNGYIASDPGANISPLKKAKAEPDPLSKDEFLALMKAIKLRQTRNLWAVAVYTGLRHGELCGLAWEDIDMRAGTLMVRRNVVKDKKFTVPKTGASTNRVIQLIKPAIDALRDQSELTRLGLTYDINVSLREFGKSVTQKCTFVFNPSITARNGKSSPHYSEGSISQSWDSALKRAGLRHRKAYQSRHTYACWSLSAGANPNFIAQQMGHSSAQMVYQVYGSWMAENNHDQVSLLNQKLSTFAPPMPQASGDW